MNREFLINRLFPAFLGVAAFALIVGSPLFGERAYLIVRACFFSFCHQLPERSFEFAGLPLPVCARCFGIYSGVSLALVIVAFKNSAEFRFIGVLLVISIVLMVVDAVTGISGALPYPLHIRFITGLMSGFSSVFFLMSDIGLSLSFRKRVEEH